MNTLIETFESQTGLTFDYAGPEVCQCPYCGRLLQYIPDHDCFGLRMDAKEQERNGFDA